ncbi:MAG: DinB family protein [Chloroflexota bacterium]
MLDFTLVREKKATMNDLAAGLSLADLRYHTNDMIDRMLGLIVPCTDADVVFQPNDPQAHDQYAASIEQVYVGWTLAHVIVHTTASSEEAAFLAAEMARGVEHHGRSRYEVPWESITTIAQCRQRLEESRRIRLSSLDLWPDEPDLALTYEPWPGAMPVNAKARFIMGLRHDSAHLGQIAEIVRQAQEMMTAGIGSE